MYLMYMHASLFLSLSLSLSLSFFLSLSRARSLSLSTASANQPANQLRAWLLKTRRRRKLSPVELVRPFHVARVWICDRHLYMYVHVSLFSICFVHVVFVHLFSHVVFVEFFFLHFPPPTLPVCTHCHLRLYRITTCILCTCCVLNCVIVYLLCSHCVLNGVLIVYSMCTLSFNIIPYYYTYIVYSIVLLCTHCVRCHLT